MNRLPLLIGAASFAVVVVACNSASATPSQITVLAASSLQTALPDLTAAWKTSHPTTSLVTSTGATSALRMQIEQGSPADVLLGADTTNAQTLVDEEAARGPVTPYATNALTVIVPANNPKGIQTAADLAKPGVCVIAAGDNVPINHYAEQLVMNLSQRSDYGSSFAANYEANVCSREDNVGAVVNKISLGEGDAAIVYVTDAAAGQNLEQVSVPADSNVVATYGGVVTSSSTSPDTAAEFVSWLTGPAGQSVLKSHGFGAAP